MKNINRFCSNHDERKIWVDVMRGVAICAVVVCHQQGLLHNSEWVQCLTLYSVTTLIFLMGYTKGLSFNRWTSRRGNEDGILEYSLHSMSGTLLSYCVASFFYDLIINGVHDYGTIVINIFDFSACGPFYFVEHFVRLSLWAPLLCYCIFKIGTIKSRAKRILMYLMFVVLTFAIGYISIGHCDIFSQSYFAVYAIGIILTRVDLPKISVFTAVISVFMVLVGFYFTQDFYFERVKGNYEYAGLLDSIVPKLHMNPPNLSIILYSAGVVLIVYHIVELSKNMAGGGIQLSYGCFAYLESTHWTFSFGTFLSNKH